jgi:hypothetical protein
VSLPINMPKRGLSKNEAAEYCGVSVKTLDRHGPTPTKIGDRTIYDRRVLDRWLDELAGLMSRSMGLPIDTPEEALQGCQPAIRLASPGPGVGRREGLPQTGARAGRNKARQGA